LSQQLEEDLDGTITWEEWNTASQKREREWKKKKQTIKNTIAPAPSQRAINRTKKQLLLNLDLNESPNMVQGRITIEID
jgi:hypothetical protein